MLLLLSLFSSCLTLCDPIDGSPPGSTVPEILQARTLKWLAISFSNAWGRKVKSLSRVWLFATPWTVAYQAPLSMGFSRQEYWSGGPSFPVETPCPFLCSVWWMGSSPKALLLHTEVCLHQGKSTGWLFELWAKLTAFILEHHFDLKNS